MRLFVLLAVIAFFLASCTTPRSGSSADADNSAETEGGDIKLPVQVRSIRAYGSREIDPPIIVRDPNRSGVSAALGSSEITIEFDIDSDIPPGLYLSFVHCNAMWQEDNNVFLHDITLSRTSAIEWQSSPYQSSYYSYRGKIRLPNTQIQFKAGGNWKARLYEYGNDEAPIAEARFFVVDLAASCEIALGSDMYEPQAKVGPAAFTIDALVNTPSPLFDSQLRTVVVYRNHRWNEPLILTQEFGTTPPPGSFNYAIATSVFGSAMVEKRFRIENVPAQNEYRVLDLSDLSRYPSAAVPARLPLPDLRRNGSYADRADDGALITDNVFASNDEYVNMEFQLDPDRFPSRFPVYLVGSFNNWSIRPDWQMYYDKAENLYKLRQWIRRGRHNYMYATGRLQTEYRNPDAITFEELEGNTLSGSQTFVALVYYRETALGGYDSIIGVGAANVFGSIRR